MKTLRSLLFLTVLATGAMAQTTGGDEFNAITTAVPFLRINPDSRSGALGDAGLATSPDQNSIYLNASKLAMLDSDYGMGFSFSPWLFGVSNDVYLAYLNGYYRFKDVQSLHASFRYSSMGNIDFTDQNGGPLGQGRPREYIFDVGYSRRLGDHFAIGTAIRLIGSDLDLNAAVQQNSSAAFGASADLTMFYTNRWDMEKISGMDFNLGVALTNIGSKISYLGDAQNQDYLPANMGVGFGVLLDIDEYNELNFHVDVNRLLVPTPVPPSELYNTPGDETSGIKEEYDEDDNGIADYRERSSIGGVFSSFADAPGGAREELQEFNVGTGLEYFYNQQFAVRMGYFWEHPYKGRRKFLVAGAGVSFSVVTLDFSYIIPTSPERNPLDNTLRFSMSFDFDRSAGPDPEEVDADL